MTQNHQLIAAELTKAWASVSLKDSREITRVEDKIWSVYMDFLAKLKEGDSE